MGAESQNSRSAEAEAGEYEETGCEWEEEWIRVENRAVDGCKRRGTQSQGRFLCIVMHGLVLMEFGQYGLSNAYGMVLICASWIRMRYAFT